MELTELQQSAWQIIKIAKIGSEITGKEITNSIELKTRSTGKSGADMRQIINALRVKGLPVCANGKGYYAARSKEELSDYIHSFEGRIRDQESALLGLQKAEPVFELKQEEGVWEL